MAWIDGIRGALVDVDGTLLVGDEIVPGASDCLSRLDGRDVVWRLTTNTTRRPRSAVASVLSRAGIEVPVDRILAPAVLARRRVLESGQTRAALLVPPETYEDFADVEIVTNDPQWVIVGDLGRGFTWDTLNRAFGWLRAGAQLVALQKNPFWHAGSAGLRIDAGPYVAALEFAAGVTAEVLGKPSRGFFDVALAAMDRRAHEVLVIGDDVNNDGRGGAAAGCRTALVRTGKFSDEELRRTGFVPDLVVDSIADLARG